MDQPLILKRTGPTGNTSYVAAFFKSPMEILYTRHRSNAKPFTGSRERDKLLEYARGYDFQRQFKFEWVVP